MPPSKTPSLLTLNLSTCWVILSGILIAVGILAVYSASIPVADQQFHQTTFFLNRHLQHLGVAGLFATLAFRMPVVIWSRYADLLWWSAVVGLLLVLYSPWRLTLHGSTRWLGFMGQTIQVAEWVKLTWIVYAARAWSEYHHPNSPHDQILKQLAIRFVILIFLLLLQPDFGSTLVITWIALGLWWLSGFNGRIFLAGVLGAISILILLMISAPYRLARWISFWDPWADQYNTGYQLTQALMAFGRGGWWGVGVGSSVQKVFYLPESYTDFIMAIFAEEMGCIGSLSLLCLYAAWVAILIQMARYAAQRFALFEAYLLMGTVLWLSAQVMINMGVNTGLLPTKGLTLPWISYGGSSLAILGVASGIILRIERDRSALPAVRNPLTKL